MTIISVVTPVLNGERYIEETIDSVLSQKGNFEIDYIIKDGGSTDKTLEILDKYHNKCRIISQEDGSPQEAINNGFEYAKGSIGCYLNADDVFEQGAFREVIQAFTENPGKKWLYGRCSIINENGTEIRKSITKYKNLLGYYYSRNILLCENFINQPATFWKMDLWRSIKTLNPKYKAAWDYELWMQMALRSAAIPVRKGLAKFRRHSESISNNFFEVQFSEEYEISKQYGNRIHALIHKVNEKKIVIAYKILAK